MILKAGNVDFAYDSCSVLKDVTFEAQNGEISGIVGPNGSGKTTLLRCLNRVLKPKAGVILLDGSDLCSMRPKEIARLMGVVPQNSACRFSFTVLESVLMGRFPHLRRFQKETAADFCVARNSLRMCGIGHLSARPVTELSGGEYQKVVIARALAQEPRILLLDEPTLHLDIQHQLDLLELLKTLVERERLTVIMVSHDLNLAIRYSQKIIVLKEGRIYRAGRPADVLDTACIKEVYKINAEIISSECTGLATVVPLSKAGG